MRISTTISFAAYRKFCIETTYRNKGILAFTAFGLLGFIVSVLSLFGMWKYSSVGPYPGMLMGLAFMLFVPLSINKQARKSYNANLRLQETIVYDISDDKLITTGESFTSEKTWEKVHKITERKDWFLVYESEGVLNLIPKSSMTETEINYLREILRRVNIAGEKKLFS